MYVLYSSFSNKKKNIKALYEEILLNNTLRNLRHFFNKHFVKVSCKEITNRITDTITSKSENIVRMDK
jgi:hypothetical protein